MARAHLVKALARRVNGQPLTGATIRVLQPGTTTPITETIYAGPTGGTTLPNPFTAALPYIDFYLDAPKRVRIGVDPPDGPEVFFEDVDVERIPEAGDITPLVPAATRYCMSTVGAGLPSFAGRFVGDKHFNQTDLKDYVLTGVIGTSVLDTFDRPDGALGTISGLTYAFNNGLGNSSNPVISGSKVVAADGGGAPSNVAYLNIGAGAQYAAIDMDYIDTSQGGSPAYVFVNMAANFSAYLGLYVSWNGFAQIYEIQMTALSGGVSTNQSFSSLSIPRQKLRIAVESSSTGVARATITAANGTVYTYTWTHPLGILTQTHAGFAFAGARVTADRFEAFAAGTLAWTSTDEFVATHTHALSTRSTTSAISTVGSGFPSFVGRAPGDLHYDLTAHREYVLTGASGGVGTDDFNRTVPPNAVASPAAGYFGAVTINGASYNWTASDARFLQIDGSRLSGVSGSTQSLALTPPGAGSTSIAVSAKFGAISDSTGVFTRASAVPGTNSLSNGYSAMVLGSTANPAVGLYRSGVNVGVGVTLTGYNIALAKPLRIDLSVAGNTVIAQAIGTDGSVLDTVTYTDGSPLTAGLISGIHMGPTSKADDWEVNLAGTQEWQQVEPVCLQTIAAGTATVTANSVKPGLRVPHATTARDLIVRLDTVPTGAAYVVTFERWNNGAFANNIGTVTVAAGTAVASTTGLSVALAKGDLIKFNVTQVGSTVAGADVQYNVDCW